MLYQLLLPLAAGLVVQPNIEYLSPTVGSLAGGTLVTIYGQNFPNDYFKNDVRVIFLPETKSRPSSTAWETTAPVICDIIPYQSSTSKIICRTRAPSIDIAGVGTFRTPLASPDINAANSDPQALDGILQVIAWVGALLTITE